MRTTPPRDMLRSWVIWWAIGAAEWLLLVDRTSLQELVVGAVIAAIAATAAVLLRGQRQLLLRRRRVPLRALIGLVTDLPRLVRVLRARRGGGLVEVPFDGDATDRVVAETFGSIAPNTLVVEVDRERGVLVAHQLVRDEEHVLP